MIFIGQASLRRAIGEYLVHYHEERNHQGLENRLIRPTSSVRRMLHSFNATYDSAECSATTTAQVREGPTEFLDNTGYTRIQGALANLLSIT